MKSFLKISFVSLMAAIPMIATAAPSASPVPLVNNGATLSPTQRVASTSYVQGAYNTLGTQINNIISDSTVPTSTTPYAAIGTTNSISENLVALDAAIRAAAGDAGETYVTQLSATVAPVENATLNYLGETTAGTNVGVNLGILDNQIKLNQNAIETLSGNGAGSVTAAIAAENERAVAAETALSNRIGTLTESGRYISKDASAFENLDTLDAQVETNMQNIGTMSALSPNGNLTGDSRSSLVSAINALDAAISSAGTASNVVNGHYIGTANGKTSTAANLTALDDQVYTNTQKIGNETMGTTATTLTGAIKEMHSQTIRVATTWGDDSTTEPVKIFPTTE